MTQLAINSIWLSSWRLIERNVCSVANCSTTEHSRLHLDFSWLFVLLVVYINFCDNIAEVNRDERHESNGGSVTGQWRICLRWMPVASRLTPFLLHLTDRQTNRPNQPHEINIISSMRRPSTAGVLELPATENSGSTLITTSEDTDRLYQR